MKKSRFILAATIAAVLLTTLGGYGISEADYKLTVPFPGQPDTVESPAQYIRTLYTFGLGFGTLLAMVMIVIGAIQYTVSEVVPAKEDAKSRIMSAIWGLVLLLVATLILLTINPKLPKLENPPGVQDLRK